MRAAQGDRAGASTGGVLELEGPVLLTCRAAGVPSPPRRPYVGAWCGLCSRPVPCRSCPGWRAAGWAADGCGWSGWRDLRCCAVGQARFVPLPVSERAFLVDTDAWRKGLGERAGSGIGSGQAGPECVGAAGDAGGGDRP